MSKKRHLPEINKYLHSGQLRKQYCDHQHRDQAGGGEAHPKTYGPLTRCLRDGDLQRYLTSCLDGYCYWTDTVQVLAKPVINACAFLQ